MRDGSYAAFPVLVFAPLCAREITRSPHVAATPIAGLGLIAAALSWQYVCVNAGWPRYARPALVLAVAGLSLCLGRGATRASLMALFSVPVPTRVLELAADELSGALLAPALVALHAIGRDTRLTKGLIEAPAATLDWSPADVGFGFAFFAAGLACHALAANASPRRILAAAGRAFALGWVAAAISANAAVLLLGVGFRSTLAQFVLRALPWLVALGLAAWHARKANSARQVAAA